MRQFIVTIPSELMDAARIDGCSEFGIYYRIVLPIIKPALGALTIYSFLGSWNGYLWPLIILRDEAKYTLPIGLANLVGIYRQDYGMLMAGTLLSLMPIVILFLANAAGVCARDYFRKRQGVKKCQITQRSQKHQRSEKGAEKRSPSTEDASLFSMKTAHFVLLITLARTRWVHSVGARIRNSIVVCPVHGYAYDTKTGECQTDPRLRIRTYPLIVEDEEIKIEVPPVSQR